MEEGKVCRVCPAHLYHISRRSRNKNLNINKVFHLDQRYMGLGRDPKNELVLPDNGTQCISRTHAILKRLPGGEFILQDNKSLNGVFVNDRKLGAGAITLRHNDTVILGGGFDYEPGDNHSQEDSDYQFIFCVTTEQVSDLPTLVRENSPVLLAKRQASNLDNSKGACSDGRRAKREKREVSPHEFKVVETCPARRGNEESSDIRALQKQLKGALDDLKTEKANSKRLGAMVDKAQAESNAIKEEGLAADKLIKDCTCTLCRDVMVMPAVIQCSHSFCFECIDSLRLATKECPMCHTMCSSDPYQCGSLNRLVKAIARKLPAEERAAYRSRVEEAEEDAAALKEIEETVGQAQMSKGNFLNVVMQWSPTDRVTFQSGVRAYRRRARRLYCELINLKPATVDR
eukprot:Ihof_evm5s429 gene=Ihof_evmTU5s429